MTQEDKELLMRDLSCRIPYGVIVNVYRMPNVKLTSVSWYDEVSVEDSVGLYPISEVKPYLFPLSSMTDEQKIEFYKFFEEGITESANETRQWLRTKRADETMRPITIAYVMVHELVIEWLNKNHFDYRGLIKKGLAIDATNLNVYYDRERILYPLQ